MKTALRRLSWVGVPLVVCLSAMVVSPALAQTGTLFVEGDNVGIGTQTPQVKLEVTGSDGSSTRIQVTETSSTVAERTLFNLVNNGHPRFVLKDTSSGAQWVMAAAGGGSFLFNETGTPVVELRVTAGGDMQIPGVMTAASFNTSSSRTLKQIHSSIDPVDILAQVVSLPITEWSFTDDPRGTLHLGPMAEDFHAAFEVGDSERHIGLMDAAGVALGAIQGMNQIVHEQQAVIEELKQQNAQREQELAELRSMVSQLLADR